MRSRRFDGVGRALLGGSAGLAALGLTACSVTAPTPSAVPPVCQGTTSIPYGPFGGDVAILPDDAFTVADPTTLTGLRLQMRVGQDLTVSEAMAPFQSSFGDLGTLDGWGTTAPIFVRVSAPLSAASLPASSDATVEPTSSVVLMDLDADPPSLVPIDIATVAEADDNPAPTMSLSPVVSLLPKHHYGFAVTSRVLDANGSCVAPSATMQDLLAGTGTDPHLARVRDREAAFIDALTAAGVVAGPSELAAAVVFTTEHTYEDDVAIAKTIRGMSAPVYVPSGPCMDDLFYRRCDGTVTIWDFRVDQRAINETTLAPQVQYVMPVSSWLPLSTSRLSPVAAGSGPYATCLFGHALGADRGEGVDVAGPAAPEGVATVAIDSVGHGQHPDGNSGLAAFFGLNVAGANAFDGLALREHLRQSTYDKLQIVEMLRPGVDLDGDGVPDVGLAQFGYAGASLGGILGGEFLPFVPESHMAVTLLAGARVSNIFKDSPAFADFITITGLSGGSLVRFLAVAQHLVDRGDPGAYVQHITHDRFAGFDSATPEMLVAFAMNDQFVPNPENFFFARNLGLPLVGPALADVGIPNQPVLPTSANLNPTHTGGVFLYDVIRNPDGSLSPATHLNLSTNVVAVTQWLDFFQTHVEGPAATIIDPYQVLGIKP